MLTSRFCIPASFIPSSIAQSGPSHRNSSKQLLLITHSLLKHIVFILLGNGSRAGSVYPAQSSPDCQPQRRKASSPLDGWEPRRDAYTQRHHRGHRRASSHPKERWGFRHPWSWDHIPPLKHLPPTAPSTWNSLPWEWALLTSPTFFFREPCLSLPLRTYCKFASS